MNVAKEMAALNKLTINDLRRRFAEVFGEGTATRNRVWLVKRIAWRMQAQAEGGLSERARQRAKELARDADLRLTPPKNVEPVAVTKTAADRDPRLPRPGTVLTRDYKGRQLQVTVTGDGFIFEGESFASLTGVAKAITGTHCNGFHFFRLNGDNR